MEKSKEYKDSYFKADTIKNVISAFIDKCGEDRLIKKYRIATIDESWEHDDDREFYSDYRKTHKNSLITISSKFNLRIEYEQFKSTKVSVGGENRGDIEDIFEFFENEKENSIVENPNAMKNQPIVFIGHGRSPQWRDLKDHLSDKHHYQIEAYETGARAGHTIRDILEEMIAKSSFAILVMTGEDEGIDGNYRARQNVIHEIGLFQGRLGFKRAIVLLEKETEEFSNIDGVQQLRFSKGNIKETFGDIIATLNREFK